MNNPGEADAADSFFLGLSLIAVAGSVDAIGFLSGGQVFVSFISGDSTQFWVAASGADWVRATAPGLIVLLFLMGVIAGHLIGAAVRAWRRVVLLLTVGFLLAVAMTCDGTALPSIFPLALAMGAQNAVVHKVGHVRVGATYATGTMVSLGARLAEALSRRAASPWAWAPHLLLWMSLSLGAVIGAIAYRALKLHALSLPLFAILLTAAFEAVLTLRMHQRAKGHRIP